VGVLPGDTLNIVPGGGSVAFAAGPESDEGGFTVTGGNAGIVSFDHIETIGPITGASGASILGTNGDDDIAIIARDSTNGSLTANGIQDFTVSVNAGPDIYFENTPALTVD